MLKFVLAREGGYVNNPNDKGGETNKGITHSTYDAYRKSQGLPVQSVKNITDKEVADIYYSNYYKASGADKIDNPQMGMYVFDTAINMGVSTAKDILNKSGGDVDKYEQLRREKYQKYVDYDKSQEVFLKGWNNRVDQLKDYASKTFPNKKFDISVEMNVDRNGNPVDYYDFEDLKNMDKETFRQNFPQILKQIINKLLNTSVSTSKKSSNSQRGCVGSYSVSGYTRADGTEVKGYTRTCGAKHAGMSQEERLAGQAKYKNKRMQDLSDAELQDAISFFIVVNMLNDDLKINKYR